MRTRAYIIHVVCFFLLLGVSQLLIAQADSTQISTDSILAIEEPEEEKLISFSRPLTEHSPDSVLFNLVKIKNVYNNPINGQLSLKAPKGWGIIGVLSNTTNVSLNPGEEISFPVWFTLSKDVIGSHTYLINAQLKTANEKFKESAYVRIPVVSNWSLVIPDNTIYFSSRNKYAPLKIILSNRGNATEHINLELKTGNNLTIRGLDFPKDEIYIELGKGRDTTLVFDVKFNTENKSDLQMSDKESSLNISARSQNIISKSVMFVKPPSYFKNNSFLLKYTPLSIEVVSQNILSPRNPLLNVYLRGNVLFNESDHNLNYRFNFLNLSNNNSALTYSQGLWRYSNMYAKYQNGRFTLEAGDVPTSGMDLGASVRGVKMAYKFSDFFRASVSGGQNVYFPITAVGADTYFNVKKLNFKLGGSLIEDNYSLITLRNVGGSVTFPLLKYQSLTFRYSTGQRIHRYQATDFPIVDDPNTTFSGNHFGVSHSLGFKNLSATTQIDNYSPFHAGNINNSTSANNTLHLKVSPKFSVTNSFRYLTINLYQVIRGRRIPTPNFGITTERLSFRYRLTKDLTATFGGLYNNSQVTNFYSDINADFTNETNNYALFSRLAYKFTSTKTFSVYYERGFYDIVSLYQQAGLVNNFNPNQLTQSSRLSATYRQNSGGISVIYIRGLLNPNQIQNIATLENNQTLMIRPYYNKYYLNDHFLLEVFGNMLLQTASQTENYSLNIRPQFFFNRGWSARLLINYNINNRQLTESEKISTRNIFVTAGVKKEFQIQQPSVKYYTLNCIFFKDINGNGIKDENEPAIEDVVTRITRTPAKPIEVNGSVVSVEGKGRQAIYFSDVNRNGSYDDFEPVFDNLTEADFTANLPKGKFSELEMISSENGQLVYEKIPEGNFTLLYFPLNNLDGLYHPGGNTENITIVGNTTHYIPFIEGFKVRGYVRVEKDKLSKNQVKLQNIPVYAVAENGQQYKALTDQNGKYNLMVPPYEGEYTIRVPNVFGANYTIEEPEYTVNFASVKTFDIEFVFKEQSRGVNMNGGYQFGLLSDKKDPSAVDEETEDKTAEANQNVLGVNKEELTQIEENQQQLLADILKMQGEISLIQLELQRLKLENKPGSTNQINGAVQSNNNSIDSLTDVLFGKINELQSQITVLQGFHKNQQSQTLNETPINTSPNNNTSNENKPTFSNQPSQPSNSGNFQDYDDLDNLIDQLIKKTNPKVNYRVEIGVFKEKMPINMLNQLIGLGSVESGEMQDGTSRFISKPFYDLNQAETYAEKLRQQGYTGVRVIGEKNGQEVPIEEIQKLMQE